MASVVGGLIGQLLARAAKRKEGKKVSGSHKGGLHPKRRQPPLRPLGHKVPKSYVATKQKQKAMPRRGPLNDGQGNERLGAKHGRALRPLNKSLEYKIREALVPENTSLTQQTSRMTASRGTSTYTAYEIGTCLDIDNCRSNANSQMPGTSLAASKNGKLHVKSAHMKLTMTNASSGLAYMRIYEYVARRSLPAGLTGVDTVIQNGFGDQITSQITNTSYGGTLFNNPRFCIYYKIVKVKMVQLGCGRSFEYNLTNQKSRVFNPIYDNSTYNLSHAGYTRGIVVQTFGQPVSYSDAGDVITSDDVKIEVIQQRRYKWSVVLFPMSGTYLSTSISTAAGTLELIDSVGDRQNNVEA